MNAAFALLLLALQLPLASASSLPDSLTSPPSWRPMKGSPAPSPNLRDPRPVIEFPCVFASTNLERASWDHPLQVDLSGASGVQLEIFCADTSPVSYFSLYFQSGAGWYHASFFPDRESQWQRVTLDKDDFTLEGRPAGWDKVSAIRVSAWRGQEKNTTFTLRSLRPTGQLGADAVVAILRGDTGAERWKAEQRVIRQTAQRIASHLHNVGIECAMLSDASVTEAQLTPAKLVILPYNPELSEPTRNAILSFIKNGGKVLAFYSLPAGLRPALNLGAGTTVKAPAPGAFAVIRFTSGALPGAPEQLPQNSHMIFSVQPEPGKSRALALWVDENGKPAGHPAVVASTNCLFMTHVLQSEDAAGSQQMLLAMVGQLVPDLWRGSVEARLTTIAQLGNFTELAPLTNHLARFAKAMPALTDGLAHRELATLALQQQAFPEALAQATLAGRKLEEAFCRAQVSVSNEFRGFWCHSAFGVKGMSWDAAVQRLASNGFTAIVPNMLWGGAAFYDSKLLPIPAAARGKDQIAECLAACRKHGLAMHVWKVNWNLGGAAPREWVDKLRREGRLQVSVSGEPQDWLCPSHPANRQLEIDSMVEVARQYAVDGLHFDYIRYPGREHCFCAGCRERFEKACALRVSRWPQDVQMEGPFGARWNDWRRGNITAVVKAVSEQARAVRPGIKISAAVFPIWDRDRDSVAQDWKAWCEQGYLDFVCPMDYTPSDRSFENMVARQVKWAGKVPCYPGLGVSASRSRFGADRAIEQILITRKYNTGGFMIFNYGVTEARDLVPLLGLGIASRLP